MKKTNEHIQRTLVLLKPDAVQRSIVGKIITRFEDAGLKIIGMKMKFVDKDFASRHYTEDIAKRRGTKIRELMIDMLASGPVIAIALEGIEAIEVVRKMVGETEPKAAQPGTIRGDFAHISYKYADSKSIGVKNVIHASSSKQDAEAELDLWFAEIELYDYQTVHEKHIME